MTPATVEAAAAGDASAFRQLVDIYRSTVCSIALAIVRDVATSEDIAQDVFVAAWQRISELRSPASFGPWIRQVTRNRAHDALRRRHRQPSLVPEADAPPAPGDPGEDTLSAERDAVLEEALEALPTDAREVLLLFYREGRSLRQVALLLDLSDDAAKKRLSRARARLRRDVLDRFADAAVQSTPKAAFSAAVFSAITAGSPAVASAATGSVTAAGGKVAAAVLTGAGLGAVLGGLGVAHGMRRLERQARSERERRALRRVKRVSIAQVVVLAIALPLALALSRHPLVIGSWYLLLIGGQGLVHFAWIPRVTAPRLAAERREDPRAAQRQRRQRWTGGLAWLLGAVAAGCASAYAISLAG